MPLDTFNRKSVNNTAMIDIDPDHPSCICCVCDDPVRYRDKATIVMGMDTQHIAHEKCAEAVNRY